MDEEEIKRLIDEYEASTGERSPLRDVAYPPGAAITSEGFPFFSRESPIPTAPTDYEGQLKAVAPRPDEELLSLIPSPPEPPELSPDLTAPKVEKPLEPLPEPEPLPAPAPEPARPSLSDIRTQMMVKAGQSMTQGAGTAIDFLNEQAKQIAQESQKATQGEEFDPAVTFKAAQLGINPTAALVVATGEKALPELSALLLPGAPPPTLPMSPELANIIFSPAYAQGTDQIAPESIVRKPPPGLSPTAERIIQSVGGPQKVNQSDLVAMGILGTTMLGMAFAPQVFRSLKLNLTPRARPVRDALPGTVAISTPLDLARTYDDVTAGAIRLARRAGVDPAAAAQLEQTFRIQSRAGARALADSAVQTGRMETPSYRFQAPVALTDLQQQMTPQAQQYLLLRDTWDQLNLMTQQRRYMPTTATPAPGPPTVAGMTLPDVNRAMFAIEQAHPEVVQISRDYNAYVRAVRKFESSGEYATREVQNPNVNNPAAENRSVGFLNSQRPNEVPFRGERSRGMAIADRENPIASQAYATRLAIRERLENETIGKYVDTVRAANPNLFRRVAVNEEEARRLSNAPIPTLAENPEWKKNTVSFYRRGQLEHYTTDPLVADWLKMDPYYITGMLGQTMYATKRLLEFGATGMGAPAFSFISALRSWQIAKHTAEQGFRSPTFVGMMRAVPDQLYPQMARAFSRSLDDGWLSRVFSGPWVDSLSRRLAYEYDNSLYAQLKTVGTAKGSILEQQQVQTQLTNQANALFAQAPASARAFWNAWRATWESIHNGPAFDFVRKNLGTEPLPQLASRARALTGDPRVGGQYYAVGPSGKQAPIRFESDSRVSHTAAQALRFGYGVPMEVMRDTVPWFNATLQGAKRIGQAYLNDPVGFTRSTWLYAMAPAASLYFYARSLGNDPQGVSYVDYMLNRRSSYNRQMNWYIPVPGKPAAEGIELPFFHELAPFKRAMEISLDHVFRSEGPLANSTQQDFWNAAHAFLDTAVIPPMPPLVSGLAATRGVVLPMGVFGGEAYQKKNDPYDQTGGLPPSLELVTRQIGGGLGQTIAQAYAAYAQTPDGFWNALKNAATEAGKVNIARAPIIRDVTGIKPPISGNTDLVKELFDKQKEIGDLATRYQKWDKEGKFTEPGQINVRGRSGGGEEVADYLLGPALSPESPGLDQPDPTNPLYLQFMEDVYARFRKESPLASGKNPEGSGAIGFLSLWSRYGQATRKIARLRNINEGNYNTWQDELNKREVKELKDNGIDTTNLRQVRNFYETKRFDAARVILYMVRAVEQDFSKQLGRPVTIKDFDPYAKPPAPQAPPFSLGEMTMGFP